MKKIFLLISTILVLFLSYILVLIIPKNYTLIYKKKDYQITEQYIKDEKKYFFEVKYKGINYPLLISKNYSKKRKLISSIDVKEMNKERCLNIIIDKHTSTICSDENNLKNLNTMTGEFLTK